MEYGQYFFVILIAAIICGAFGAAYLILRRRKRAKIKQDKAFVIEDEIVYVHTEEVIRLDS